MNARGYKEEKLVFLPPYVYTPYPRYSAAFACRALTEVFSGLRLHGHMAGTVHISRTFEELRAQ